MAGARPTIVIVGLGPAGTDLTTAGATERLAEIGHVRLRTHRHPAAAPYADLPSYDSLYETAATFDEVYLGIADDLVATATEHGEVAYAIPGSPFVLERTVALLRSDERVDVEIVSGMSFLDLAWGRIGVDPVEAGVTLVDGHRFAIDAAGATGALLVAHCHAAHVLSDIKLAFEDDEPAGAVVLRGLGLPEETVVEVDWADLDRAVDADHLTSLFIPAVRAPVAQELVRFQGLVRTLREQCPWDREQTHESLRRYLVEETYEVVEAIDGFDPESPASVEHLEEELGDLLYQVFFHSAIAAEEGAFTIADVARGIHDKLHRRHPHVFGDADADSIESDWEAIKKAEKGRGSVMDGIPVGLPGLLYAHKVLSKADRAGVEIPMPTDPAGELGSVLLGLVAHARANDIDAESAIRAAADRVGERVRAHEAHGG
ncbi:MazG nucleotide pyrophosphohydrolase domain-containing protein [Actinospongicola halichondriae]|uniref:MazG nucleotide pyrophosphohydrolase domain-containing protein n=1 Tax=Actinospongicola halichondriae TaxID=3236844 RepID=UPI003D43E69B